MAKGFAETSKRRNGKYFSDGAKSPSERAGGATGRAEERRIVAAAKRGDPAAMRRLLALVARPAFRFGMTFCRHREDAEEIAQDVLASLVRALPRYRGDGTLSTWAYTVARHACLRRRRASKPAASLESWRDENDGEPVETDPASDPHGNAERGELRDSVAAALRSLPSVLREAVVLRDVEGLSAREAASVLRITERALKSRLHRGRAELRERLKPLVADDAADARSSRCPDVGRAWSLHLEGDVSASVCARLEAHVRTCPECAATCRTMRATLRQCRLLRTKRLPAGARRALASATAASRKAMAARG
ncbi:MAG TPA: RNA polymerase sigma factor [Candidatus Eisenbacteria bacterium]|nr:RNA polymerase sigma factor [Candidatus Eisenbacteria bacterium]